MQELFTFTFDKSSTWVTNEFVSLTNLSKSAYQHQDSATHLQVSLKMQELIFSKMDMRKVMIQKNNWNYLELLEVWMKHDSPRCLQLDSTIDFMDISSKIQSD